MAENPFAIRAVELALLRALQNAPRVRGIARTIASYQGQLDQDISTMTDLLPAVYVLFERSESTPLVAYQVEKDLYFTVLCAAASLADRAQTTRFGAQGVTGAYELLEEVERALTGNILEVTGVINGQTYALYPLYPVSESALLNTITLSIYAATYVSRANLIPV